MSRVEPYRYTGTKIVAIGSNYRDHAIEMGKPVPEIPKIFLKAPSAVIYEGDPIVIPPGTQRVDHEAELAVVIGQRASRVPRARALEVVAGYTICNDVTARDFQRADGVFARAKGYDSFCPLGPVLVAGIDPSNLTISCWVNNVRRQHSRTDQLVFDIATLIAFVTDIMTLYPGDVISTGTPAGVGPLLPGDVVTIEIEGIGRLTNPVVARDDRVGSPVER
ncbi:MAG: FAA hydrolase family protein [Myxococcales bacterium]|nr:FAA hydrolase family protein [Myxococcales bacterium]